MRNRAKCKLCSSIIESFHSTDYVICKCGHISVDAGPALKCAAKDWNNFLRIDDDGNEIIVKVEKSEELNKDPFINDKITKKDLLLMLDDMIGNIEKLPQAAMTEPITHYDLCSVLILFSSIFKSEDSDRS